MELKTANLDADVSLKRGYGIVEKAGGQKGPQFSWVR